MLSTKKDVDRQVRTHLAKLRTDNEVSKIIIFNLIIHFP